MDKLLILFVAFAFFLTITSAIETVQENSESFGVIELGDSSSEVFRTLDAFFLASAILFLGLFIVYLIKNDKKSINFNNAFLIVLFCVSLWVIFLTFFTSIDRTCAWESPPDFCQNDLFPSALLTLLVISPAIAPPLLGIYYVWNGTHNTRTLILAIISAVIIFLFLFLYWMGSM